MKSMRMLILSLFLVLGLTSVAGAQTLFRAIDQAQAQGEIDIETALLMKASAATGKTLEYYEAYLPGDGDPRLPTSLTKLAIDIHNNWDSLSDYAQAGLVSFVKLPKLDALNSFETDHFDIRYGDDNTPSTEFLEAYEDYLEASWAKLVVDAGFAAPVESGKMIVLIGNTGTPSEGIPDNSFLDSNITVEDYVYGFATWDEMSGEPFLVLNDDYSAMTGSSDVADWGPAMQATAAHEFQHDTQFAEGWYGVAGDLWWAEASAVWSEDFVFDAADDYLQYVASQVGNYIYANPWPAFPNISLLYFNGAHEYGNVLFAKYLSEVEADDAIVADIWHAMSDYFATSLYPAALSAIDDSITGGLAAAFVGFVANNAIMNYEEGANYAPVTIIASYDYADFPLDDPDVPDTFDNGNIEVNALPDVLGANYIELVPEGGVSLMSKSSLAAQATEAGDDDDDDDNDTAGDDDDDNDDDAEEVGDAITIAFEGDAISNGEWAVVIVGIAGGEIVTTDEMEIEDGAGEITIEDFNSGDYDTFYMIPAVLPRGDLGETAANFEPAPSSDNLYEDYPQGNGYNYTVNLGSSSIDPDDSGCDCSIGGTPTAEGFYSALLILSLPLIGLAILRRRVRVKA